MLTTIVKKHKMTETKVVVLSYNFCFLYGREEDFTCLLQGKDMNTKS